jgi:choline dehydrogenase
MQDHLGYDHAYRSTVPSLNNVFLPLHGKVQVGLRYLLGRKGPLSLSVNQGGGFFRSRPELERPDIQLYFSPLSYEKATPGVRALMKPDPFPGFYTSVSPCRPTSRGRIEIGSSDPAVPPRIIPNYLSTPEDVETLLAGARFLCRLSETPSLSSVIAEELRPGAGRHSDEALLEDIRQRAYSIFHPCGTCRMGPEPGRSVVDPALRVWGLEGLRVADASIFPTVTSGNTNAPAMLVGEKAAELMLAGS